MARSRPMEAIARCGLVIMSVAHLTCSLLFVSKLSAIYLGLAVIIAVASLVTLLDAGLFLCTKARSHDITPKRKCFWRACWRCISWSRRGRTILMTILWTVAMIQSLYAVVLPGSVCPDAQLDNPWAMVGGCLIPKIFVGTCTFTVILACLLIVGTKQTEKHSVEKCSASIHHSEQEDRETDPQNREGRLYAPKVPELPPSSIDPRILRPPSRGLSRAWLPPLRFQLASTRADHSAQLISPSDFSLARRRTCDTSSSSRYSRTRSASLSTLSRHPSTISSISNQTINSQTRIVSTKDTPPTSKPALPAIPKKYLHASHSLRGGGGPVRPGSRPAMPPAEFWKYADKQRMRNTYVSTSESHKTHCSIDRSDKREPSVCRYPILATPAKPVCRARRATVQSETGHIKNPSYESVRKGPLDRNSRIRSMASVAEIGVANNVAMNETGKRCSSKVGPKRRESRTLTKQRQPSRK